MNPIKLWWEQEKFMHAFGKEVKKQQKKHKHLLSHCNKCRKLKNGTDVCIYCPHREENPLWLKTN